MARSDRDSRLLAAVRKRSLADPLSKAKQARRRPILARSLAAPLAASLFAAALAGCGGHSDEATDCPAAQRNTPSGFCVPRWVSLKHGEVMARKGPGKDYPALWVYHVDGLPVQIVAETEEWRRICGPDGGAAWVNRSEIDGRRTLLNTSPTATPILKTPKEGAKEVGLLNSRALARVRRCAAGWCQIRVGGLQGWMAVDQVWGVDEARQCK